MNKKIIIFCLSYLSVPATMSLVESQKKPFLIITSNRSLLVFFERFYSKENIFFIENKWSISHNIFRTLYNCYFISKYKKKIFSEMKLFKDGQIFFFAIAFCDFEAWLITRLSKGNEVFYCPSVSVDCSMKDRSIKSIIGKWLRKFIYSIDTSPLVAKHATCYALNEKYFQAINAKSCNLKINVEKISNTLFEKIPEIKNKKIIFLCGGYADIFVDKKEYKQKIGYMLFSLTEKYGHNSIAIKPHPRFSYLSSEESKLHRIPSEVPANLILDHFDVVIGYSTATLIEAANAGKNAISLLRLLEPKDPCVRDSYISYLENNSTAPIYYPESVNELMELIKNKE